MESSLLHLEQAIEALSLTNEPPGIRLPELISRLGIIARLLPSIEDEIDALKKRCSALLREKAMIEMIVSPLRRLPPEVVGEVLKQSVPNPMGKKQRLHFANLRSVCRRWRQVAFTTSSLWAGISLEIEGTGPGHLSKAKERVNRWFKRAGHCPLTFEINMPSGIPLIPLASYRDILSITANSMNWYCLDFWTPSSIMIRQQEDALRDLISTVQRSTSLPWGHLQRLSIPLKTLTNHPTGRTSFSNFLQTCTPGLQTLTVDVSDAEDVSPIAHKTLTTLMAFGALNSSNLVMLNALPNLRALTVATPLTDRGPTTPIIHYGVQTLIYNSDFAPSVLRSLTLPNLYTLQAISLPDVSSPPDFKALVDFLRRSKCPLKKAVLQLFTFQEKELAPVLRILSKIPTLECLHFTSVKFIQQLTCTVPGKRSDSSCDPLLFPGMREMTVYSNGQNFNPLLLLQFLEERKATLDLVYPESGEQGHILKIDLRPLYFSKSEPRSPAWESKIYEGVIDRLRKLNVLLLTNGRQLYSMG
ncbi:hypothetical protein BKA70DRAFT_667153 [Coprinopsis sp. MPI-PUGE-AT-0042]|nr:hypothetical protein BKA70DRAFT_667153 [Coprinopsis sp. MPI-PUGE-AT-0042]